MRPLILAILVVATLSGCATGSAIREKLTGDQFDEPVVDQSKYLKKEGEHLNPPHGGPITVAVYGFRDLTGQRKSVPNIASLSSAVTQGADAYLIKALQDVGEARWFTVVERVGLENLIKERQMIRQMREQYQGREAKQLPPMLFAGVIVEGGIVGYDSNTTTGGAGARFLGIGVQTQYQSDTVTINLRTVSVATGEVLTSITITKTVLSYMDKLGVLKFVEAGEKAVEAEIGASINESINKATNMAIQAAVIATIKEGARKGHWAFKDTMAFSHPEPATQEIRPAIVEVIKEVPLVVEEKKDPVVEEKKDPVIEEKKIVKKEEPKKIGEVTDWSNARKNKDIVSERIINLKPGTKVEILNSANGFYYVKQNGKEGWVQTKFIKVQQ